MGSMPSPSDAGQPQGDIRPISNSTLKSDDPTGAPVNSSGFLGAPTTLASGVLESSEPTPAPQSTTTAPVTSTAPATTPAAVTAPAPAATANGRYVVQVGAVSEQSRAQQYQKRLSQQFGVLAGWYKTAQSGVSRWGRLPAKLKPPHCSSVFNPRRNYSPSSPACNNVNQVSELSVSVNDINKVTRKVRCLPVMHLL